MGCHVYMYEIVEEPKFDLEKEQEKFLKIVDDIRLSEKWASLHDDYPFFFDVEIEVNQEGGEDYFYEVWFDIDNERDYDIFILDDDLIPLFKSFAFKVPCAEIVTAKSGEDELVKIEPQFLAFKEVSCPWIRIYPYNKVFVTCDSFLEHLRSHSEEDYAEYANFFKTNFRDGKHIVRLG